MAGKYKDITFALLSHKHRSTQIGWSIDTTGHGDLIVARNAEATSEMPRRGQMHYIASLCERSIDPRPIHCLAPN